MLYAKNSNDGNETKQIDGIETISYLIERAKKSGDQNIEYDHQGRVSKIGDEKIEYDYQGRIARIGD